MAVDNGYRSRYWKPAEAEFHPLAQPVTARCLRMWRREREVMAIDLDNAADMGVCELCQPLEDAKAELLCVRSELDRAQGYAAGLEAGADQLKELLRTAEADRDRWHAETERLEHQLLDVRLRLHGGGD